MRLTTCEWRPRGGEGLFWTVRLGRVSRVGGAVNAVLASSLSASLLHKGSDVSVHKIARDFKLQPNAHAPGAGKHYIITFKRSGALFSIAAQGVFCTRETRPLSKSRDIRVQVTSVQTAKTSDATDHHRDEVISPKEYYVYKTC